MNPTTIAPILLIPICSFKNIFANIEMKNGLEKNSALAIAKVMKVKEI